jgi:hypothetical protein
MSHFFDDDQRLAKHRHAVKDYFPIQSFFLVRRPVPQGGSAMARPVGETGSEQSRFGWG